MIIYKTKQTYFCKDCGTKICSKTALNGKGTCYSCAKIGKNHPCFGKHLSKDIRIKLSKAKIGKKNHRFGKHLSKEEKLKLSKALKGKKISQETRFKMSQSQTLRFKNPKNHHNYIDGTARSPYNKKFSYKLKIKIRERDNYACQICCDNDKKLNRALHVHHIDYNKNNCEQNNLMSLCNSCHIKTNGSKNFDRSYWYAYCTYLMENR